MAVLHNEAVHPQAGDELLAKAFHAAPNGFVMVDEAGTIIAANRQLEAMFGHPPGALVGRSLDLLLPEHVRGVHEQYRHGYAQHPEPRAMGGGRVLYGRHADGHEFPVEIGLNPVPGAQGLFVLASVVDISERMGLEMAFRGLFDASPYGLMIVDDDGFIVMANAVLANSLGYTPTQLTGGPLEQLLPARYRGRHGALMHGYHGTGEARMMGRGRDLTALHADGTEVPVEIGLSRVRWQRRMMTLAVITDIHVRKRMETDLRQANADLQEFTYVASHDLRSPLRGIADLVGWIVEDLGPDISPEVQRNLDRVTQRIARMDRLIDDLLRYARAGRTATDFKEVDLRKLVEGILELQPPPEGFQVELALDVPTLQTAQTPLETVLRNLLANAVKHHDRTQASLKVSAEVDDNYCHVSVTDDGPGVPPQARERIFKLFQTLTATERGGSGIGLALTKRLVETHGGRIEVHSPVADGRGACFRFSWPRFLRRSLDAHA
jgi:PAS domain S-box-containing protein